jgi:hypothetical protein
MGCSGVEILQPVPAYPGFLRGRRPLPGEDPPSNRGSPGIGELADLLFQLFFDGLGGADGAPLAFAEVGPAVFAQADEVDLGGLGPVLADLEGGAHAFAGVEPGEGLAAETLEAEAEVGVQVRTDQVAQGSLRSDVPDGARVGEDEAEPEAQQRVRQLVADGAGGGLLPGQGIAPLEVAQLQELLEVVGEVPRVLAGLPGDLLDRAVAGRHGVEHGVIGGDLPELFAQEEVGLPVEGGVFVQQLGGDVGFDGAAVVEPLEVQGDTAAEEVGAGLVGAGCGSSGGGRGPLPGS